MSYKLAMNKPFFAVLFAIFVCSSGLSSDVFSIRAHTGIGVSRSANSSYSGTAYHVGARFLLHASNNKNYGIETSWFNLVDAGDIVVAGIVLENKVRNWFHMSIGTIGYFNFSDKADNPVGLTTNLGWEPEDMKFKPLIVLRNDFVFYDKIVIIQSISLGLSW